MTSHGAPSATEYLVRPDSIEDHPQRQPPGVAVGRTIANLAKADELPGPTDYEATRKPLGKAWVRRVGGRNLWVWYRFNDEEVILAAVTTEPPTPVDDE